MFKIFFVLFACVVCKHIILCDPRGKNENTRTQSRGEMLDPLGRYFLEWEADFETKTVVFSATVQTTGFVGFGISPHGGMTGADIVIGGIWPNGTKYFQDYHGVGNFGPELDTSQDWHLSEVSENTTHTHLSFYRLFNTCDDQDVAITNDTTNFIWSFGSTDRILYHGPNRGTYAVNILDPAMPDIDLSQFEKWSVNRTLVMPSADTTYWCTVHKMPKFEGVHHVVAFKPYLPNPVSLKHTHHFNIYKCTAPPGVDPTSFFEPYVGLPGGECFNPELIPVGHCRSIVYVWAIGGKGFYLPEHIGYPVNEFGLDEYVLFEVHYDNPEESSGVVVEAGVEIYHTDKLREVEAGIMAVTHDLIASHMIPPKSVGFTTVGHCSSECTSTFFPPEGVNIFNVLLHSHLSGRRLRLRQFRDGIELPWVSNDDNYIFNYQQNRPLRQEVKVLPGDQLTYECVTDTTWTEGVVLAGFSTEDEMCESFLWYYPRQNIRFCGSMYFDFSTLFNKFGIQEVDWSYIWDPTVIAPPSLANKTFSDVLNEFPWTPELREEVQRVLRFSPHVGSCFPSDDSPSMQDRIKQILQSLESGAQNVGWVSYPGVNEDYLPPDECSDKQ